MSKSYTDYINQIVITVPDTFIDVMTGDSYEVSTEIKEQIEYHTDNNTLLHLVFSALNSYLHPKRMFGGTEEVLLELLEIKKILHEGYVHNNKFQIEARSKSKHVASVDLSIKEIEDILVDFGG